MKIDNTIKPAVASGSDRVAPRPNAAKTAAGSPEDVKLSALAAQLQATEGQASVDSARVEEIKQAIAEGRFPINAGAIAERLIDSARELIDSQRRA